MNDDELEARIWRAMSKHGIAAPVPFVEELLHIYTGYLHGDGADVTGRRRQVLAEVSSRNYPGRRAS